MTRARKSGTPGSPGALRALPSVESLLATPPLRAILTRAPRPLVLAETRAAIQGHRDALQRGQVLAPPSAEAIATEAAGRVEAAIRPSLRPVLNATGVVLHTNLGRAPLAEEAVLAVLSAARHYTNVELTLSTGGRGSRMAHLEPLLCELLRAPAALVVNNNAAAMLLALNTLALGKEAVVSRGQLVEIGGSFRIPDILERAGATLREVGTTNKTRVRDYERAIGPRTGLILNVHRSNFAIVGFSEDATRSELVRLARRKRIPLLEDVGSGALVDLAAFGLPAEPRMQDALAEGVPLVCASGDKLLGGPQAGILAGSKALIAACKANPMARALRVDKLTLAALEATLRLYRDPETLGRSVPILRMLGEAPSAVRSRARRVLRALGAERSVKTGAEVIACSGEVGGGAMPLARVPSFALALRSPTGRVEDLARALRLAVDPVLGRIEANRLLLDMRTVTPRETPRLIATLARVLDEV